MKNNLYNKMLKYCIDYFTKNLEDKGNDRRLERILDIKWKSEERGNKLEEEKDYITVSYKYCLFG